MDKHASIEQMIAWTKEPAVYPRIDIGTVVAAINADGPYWIDMESKVRTNDRFDLALCRRVREAVFEPSQKKCRRMNIENGSRNAGGSSPGCPRTSR